LLAAMSDVDPSESGLASGIVNTSFMMGGALGLAVLASLAAARSEALQAAESAAAALGGGYHAAFLVGAIFAAVAGVLGGLSLRRGHGGGEDAKPAAGAGKDGTPIADSARSDESTTIEQRSRCA
jgi:hypothetical protein